VVVKTKMDRCGLLANANSPPALTAKALVDQTAGTRRLETRSFGRDGAVEGFYFCLVNSILLLPPMPAASEGQRSAAPSGLGE
jgi:hypothetical protein